MVGKEKRRRMHTAKCCVNNYNCRGSELSVRTSGGDLDPRLRPILESAIFNRCVVTVHGAKKIEI